MRYRLVATLALVVGVFLGVASGGGTFASFSNATSNVGNSFTAASDFGGSGVLPVRELGTASCGNSSNSLSVPAGGVPVGNTIIARLAHRTTVNAAVTISDNRNNAWTKDADVFQGNIRIVVFSAYVTKALAQNDQITVTFPANGDGVGLTVEEFSGIASTNRVDAVGTASGDSVSPSAAVTTANGNDFLYGAVANTNNRTYTEASGWTSGKHQVIDCGGAPRKADNHGATRQVATTGTYTYGPTLNSSTPWAAAVVAYRAAGGGPSCGTPTPVHLTGFEYGPTVAPSTGLADGLGYSAGIPGVESAVKRHGAYSLEIPKSTGGTSYVDKSFPVSATAVVRFALRLESLPASDVSSLVRVVAGAGSSLDLEYLAAQNRFEIAFGTAAGVPATGTVQAGRWYVFDLKVNYGANPRTADWRIDGVDQPQASLAEAASTATAFRYGSDIAADAFTANYDDVFISVTPGDYPLGDGKILALRPDGEGSSTLRGNFGNETGTLIGQNPHLRLDDDPVDSITDYIWQDTESSTANVALTFQDVSQTCIRGVSALAAYNSSGTGGNNGKTSIFVGTTERVLLNGDMSAGGTGLRYAREVVSPAGASYWTQSALNGIVARFGYSTDVAPAPRWHAFMVEYGTMP